ncbi:MAG: (2Fe-2S)-binding protein [Acidimicrobiales bacterium]
MTEQPLPSVVPPGERTRFSLTVNGDAMVVEAEARRSLADVLREECGLTGTHLGCEHGVCGACTVLLDGRPVRSCLMLGVQAGGAAITTVEGLADGPAADAAYHPVQQAMHDAHGFQCGFCSPGFLLTAAAYLERRPDATRDDVREELSGNLCRCTGYASIIDGVLVALDRQEEQA